MNIPVIQTSKNYEQFTEITGNRLINENKVAKLVTDIQSGLNLLPYCPIIVFKQENKYKIVDGQHRFEACVQLGHPVYYIEAENMELKHIARMNSRSDKWRNKDFISCYIELNNPDYVILYDFMKEYGTIYSASVELLMYGSCKGRNKNSMDQFRDGEFKVNYYEEAVELVELVKSLFFRYKFWNDRYLITAVQELKNRGIVDFDKLSEKIKEAPNEMDKQTTWKEYIYNIERVYNYRRSKRIAIF